MELSRIKNLELDKICRVCLASKKDMRPLFGEMVADMLMECARVTIENTDGWPDKICIQCVHQVSRCHAFKTRVEKSDQELRNYIKGLTVIVEEPITQIDIQPQSHHPQTTATATVATTNHHHSHHHHHQQHQHQHQQQSSQPQAQQQQIHHNQRITTQTIQTIKATDLIPHQTRQEIHQQQQQHHHPRQTTTASHHHHHHQVHQVQTATAAVTNEVPQQMVISNGQLHNAQILNTGQIVTTTTHHGGGQQLAQIVNAGQIGQLIQTGNTVQMIQQNGQPAQVVQIQRTADDRCEIIVQPDVQGEAQYFEDVTVTQAIQADQVETTENVIHIQQAVCDEEIEEEEDELMSEDFAFELEISDDSDAEDKLYLAEFISLQTSCPSPGRYVCNLCRKEFKHSKWLQTHMKSHSNWIKANCKRQPQCEICHRSFKGPGMLKMHMKTHETADKPPTCTVCNKTFKSKTILYRHRQTHQAKSYQCGNCYKAFTSPYTLSSHMTKKHSTDEQKFSCFHCDEMFTSIEELKTHIPARHGAK